MEKCIFWEIKKLRNTNECIYRTLYRPEDLLKQYAECWKITKILKERILTFVGWKLFHLNFTLFNNYYYFFLFSIFLTTYQWLSYSIMTIKILIYSQKIPQWQLRTVNWKIKYTKCFFSIRDIYFFRLNKNCSSS